MTGEEIFEIWAPGSRGGEGEGPGWSRWAKPVLFAQAGAMATAPGPAAEPAPGDEAWWPEAANNVAVVVDLPGEVSVRTGLKLARRGYRPVPLFNACMGPGALVDLGPVVAALDRGATELRGLRISAGAPPAFLLDAGRLGRGPGRPGQFDNRSVVLPQDFPSAVYLLSWRVTCVLLVQEGRTQPRDDLAHVLLRWQEGGLPIAAKDMLSAEPPAALAVGRPPWYRALWYAALAVAGLRRHSAGGFGSIVPMPSSSGG